MTKLQPRYCHKDTGAYFKIAYLPETFIMIFKNCFEIYILDSDFFLYARNLYNEHFKLFFFLVQNHLLNICSRVVNSQRLFCSQKAGVKFYQDYAYNNNQ